MHASLTSLSPPPWMMVSGLLASTLSACAPFDATSTAEETSVGSTSAGIKNGTVWDPWASSYQAWTRNVVRIRNCTGTLIHREWVLTAGHCFEASTPPWDIAVSHTGANGAMTYTRGVEAFRYPYLHGRGQDVALVRIETPIDTGQGDLDFFTGTTSSLVGARVLCAGYGWMDVGGPCTANADCSGDLSCGRTTWGRFCRKTSSSLRVAWMDVIADPDDATSWYRFDVPNSSGQILLPGDSGATCMSTVGLTGIHKSGNTTDYNRQTSAAVFRDWVNGIVHPEVIAQSNYPGAACEALGTSPATPDATAEQSNLASSSRTFVCPIERAVDASGRFANVFRAPRVFVRDQHPSLDVCCALQTRNPSGTPAESTTVCSSGSSSGYQSLEIPTVYDNTSWSQASLRCTVPGTSASGSSAILTYRTLQARR